jgi:TonB family protein
MRRALTISLGLHVSAFLALMYAPPISLPTLPPPSPSEYQQAFAGKEDKIVWYKFRELPDITPPDSPKARRPLRAAVEAKQAIVSSPKDAPKRELVVVAPLPAIEPPPLDLPNLIAVKLPPKEFTTPPDLVRPEPPKIELPDAPETVTQQVDAAKLPKTYIPPPTPVQKAVKVEAPSDSPVYQTPSPLSTRLPAIRLPSRPYVPPQPLAAAEQRKIEAATAVTMAAVNAPASAAMPGIRLPARAYAPPRSTAGPQAKPTVAIPQIDGPAGDVTIAIAGLNPATTAVKLPAASSPAQFSAGQKVRPDGATSDGAAKGITATDLYAHSTSETKPELLARVLAAPTSKTLIDDSLRLRPVPANSSTRVSNAPDPRFNGRDVYMMAIQMSNLTSYSGSWLMWYADRTLREATLQPISAPVPHRKVDPKYIASAVSDHVQGRVQLFCVIGREGNVTSIELLRGADERLNRSAMEALSKWEFYPATRNGQPVDVDVVVEIPFVLAPASLPK